MRTLLIIFLTAFTIYGCSESEDTLVHMLEYSNPYEITNNPDDPVQAKRYELYTKYGVSTYFNDTIAQVKLRNDFEGNPVYTYETLDFPWSFYGYARLHYKYTYITDEAEKLQALECAERYLENNPSTLYPYNFFLISSYEIEDSNGKIIDSSWPMTYKLGFRTAIVTSGWTEDSQIDGTVSALQLGMIIDRITEYKQDLAEFYELSPSSYYYKSIESLDPAYYSYVDELVANADPNTQALLIMQGRAVMHPAVLAGGFPYNFIFMSIPDEYATLCRDLISRLGKLGFVNIGASSVGVASYAPEGADYDLELYAREIISLGKDGFTERWGDQELVMKKFEVVYNTIVKRFGIEF